MTLAPYKFSPARTRGLCYPLTMTKEKEKPRVLIGLTGLAGSGKDTVAEMLMNNWERNEHFHARLAFAFPIQQTFIGLLRCARVDNPEKYVERDKKELPAPVLNISYRQFAQTFGTDYAHELMGRDVWIRCFESRMQDYIRQRITHFVIPDVRFAVEADWVRSQGGTIWRIERPGVTPVREHVSEAGVAHVKADRVIHNTGTLEDLSKAVRYELAVLNYEQTGLVKSTQRGGQ